MISDGSELLLLVPSLAGIVGSVVLPVLGAVPDGAIVLFSGMGDDAQSELSVGVGALAGSTIMLLTIPWFLATWGGRVDIDKETGLAVYKRPSGAPLGWSKLTPGLSFKQTLLETGVTGSPQVRKGGKLMMITAISYLIIQGPAFFLTNEPDAEVSAAEAGFALTGLITCTILFIGYLMYQWEMSRTDNDQVLEDHMEEVRRDKIMKGEISLLGVMQAELRFEAAGHRPTEGGYQSMDGGDLVLPEKVMRHLEKLLRPFFDKYDRDNSGQLDMGEFLSVFHDLQEHVQTQELNAIFEKIDTDRSGLIDFDEFVTGVAKFVLEKKPNNGASSAPPAAVDEETNEGDLEEHEEMPEDLADLDPDTQQFHVKMRAAYLMVLGTALVLTFSDPMVDVLGVLGDRTHISSFYISFVLAPLASNASELIAAFNYSLKKTSRTIVISFAALQGAACMNNTFCLGVFMFLIFFRSLAWEFSAETVTILLVQGAMAVVSLRNTHRVIDGIMVLCQLVVMPLGETLKGIFGKKKPLKEVLRENKRTITRAVRDIDREKTNLEKQEKKLIGEIKKNAKAGQMGAVKVLAKDLVRTRNYVTKFIEFRSHLQGVGLKLETVRSHEAMAGAMKDVTKAMVSLNKQVNVPALQKIMLEFARENERSELTGELIGDTLDDALADDGDAEAEDKIVSQVLDEIGVSFDEGVPEAPTAGVAHGAAGTAETAKQPVAAAEASGGGGGGPQPPAPPGAGGDAGMSELEARLNNLRRGT
eukprot:g7143.t1